MTASGSNDRPAALRPTRPLLPRPRAPRWRRPSPADSPGTAELSLLTQRVYEGCSSSTDRSSTWRSRRLARASWSAQAGCFGLGEGVFFDKNALPFVAAPGATESHHNRSESACFLCPPGEGRVAGSQEDQLVEIGALEAQRSVSLHEQQVTGAVAFRAAPLLQC